MFHVEHTHSLLALGANYFILTIKFLCFIFMFHVKHKLGTASI